MGSSVQRPQVGVLTRYEGVYRPHWERAHIAVRVSRINTLRWVLPSTLAWLAADLAGCVGPVMTWVALTGAAILIALPADERWAPLFPPDCHDRFLFDEEGGPIVFEGVVSPRGLYGHLGYMRRVVEIVRVVRYRGTDLGVTARLRP